MKYILGLTLAAGMSFSSCMDDFDAPDVSNYTIFAENVGSVNTTIAAVKSKYCASTTANFETKIEEDLVFEGVVVSNDGPIGALYQTVLLRSFEGESLMLNGQNVGHFIQLAVKNTCLYPYFPIGQKLRVNLKNLYVGAYSKVPKVGFPYFTSKGNHRLGPMPFELCSKNIQVIGQPDPTCAECVPVDLTASGVTYPTMKYQYVPMLATIRGKFVLGDDKTIMAPDELEDEGYAVDRDFKLSNSSLTMTVRTSTGNEISVTPMPSREVSITGILTYYSNWQIQFRMVEDMQ